MAMDILEDAQQDLEFNEDGKTIHGASLLTILRKEVDFQYTLRNYSSDIFVQVFKNLNNNFFFLNFLYFLSLQNI